MSHENLVQSDLTLVPCLHHFALVWSFRMIVGSKDDDTLLQGSPSSKREALLSMMHVIV